MCLTSLGQKGISQVTIILLMIVISACSSKKVQYRITTNKNETIATQQQLPDTQAVTQISPALLKEEIELIKTHLLAIHPNPFLRVEQEFVEAQFDKISQSISYPLSRAEFFLRISPLLTAIKDTHSYVHLPKDDDGDFRFKNESLFPLAVLVEDDSVYVAADLSDEPMVPTGAQLVSINSAPISFLMSMMRNITPQETVTGQNRKIQMDFAWLLASLGYAGESYRVSYRLHGQEHEIEVRGLTLKEKSKNNASESYYGFSKLTASTSLLWLNDFNEKPEQFNQFLDLKFAQMEEEGVNNLVIDLRYNNGGLIENLKDLLSRITHNPIDWVDKGNIKISPQLKKHHRHATKKRRKNKYDWSIRWFPLEWTDGLQHEIYWSNDGEMLTVNFEAIEPKLGFQPENVWVVSNGFCYSACSLFIATVKKHQLATVIGEKAGSKADIQFAYPLTFILPHSKLKVTLPTMTLTFSEGGVEDLISPDIEIKRTQNDIELRRDPILRRAVIDAER